MDPLIARKLARTTNPFASIVFFAPEVAGAYAAVGLPSGQMGYFAGRAAPMGAVSAEVVIATFYNFQPGLIRSYIPAAWYLASPPAILERRLTGVDEALRRALGDSVVAGPDLAEAAELATVAARACRPDGRALFAGHASLPWPQEPHLQLWHALTLLREHRGDGHIVALQAAGYSGCEALVMHKAIGVIPAAFMGTRAWSADELAAAADGLRSRGLIDADEAATEAGRAHREAVEEQTDLLALAPLQELGEAGCLRLRELVRPMSVAIVDAVFPAALRS